MKKVLIDIGTHEAQELCVLTCNRKYMLMQYFKWLFDWLKRRVKVIIRYKGLIYYGEGGYKRSPLSFKAKQHWEIIKYILRGRGLLQDIFVISIDPVFSITMPMLNKIKNKIGKLIYFPIAIYPHTTTEDSGIISFYLDRNSLSSSLFRGESSVDEIFAPIFKFDYFLKSLINNEPEISSADYIIRMNCEGAEYGVLRSLDSVNITPLAIWGSINDVYKKFGEQDSLSLSALIEKKGYNFYYFKGSDPSTWIENLKLFGMNDEFYI